jgi:hypothetical protein
MAQIIKSAPTSPVLTAVDSPRTEASSAHVTHETLDKAPVSERDLEAHVSSDDRSSPPGTPYSTSTLTSLMLPAPEPSGEKPKPSHTDPLNEQDVKDIVNDEMLAVAKEFGDEVHQLTGQFSTWAQGFRDEIRDGYQGLSGGYQQLSAQVQRTIRSVEETNRYLEERGKQTDVTLARTAARQAERKAKREAQKKELDPNPKT